MSRTRITTTICTAVATLAVACTAAAPAASAATSTPPRPPKAAYLLTGADMASKKILTQPGRAFAPVDVTKTGAAVGYSGTLVNGARKSAALTEYRYSAGMSGFTPASCDKQADTWGLKVTRSDLRTCTAQGKSSNGRVMYMAAQYVGAGWYTRALISISSTAATAARRVSTPRLAASIAAAQAQKIAAAGLLG